MPVTAEGPISLPLENLRVLVANCPAFQAWTDTPDAATAAARAHLVDFDPPENGREYAEEELAALRRCVVIDEFSVPDDRPGGDCYTSDRIALGTFQDGGKLLLRFYGDVAEEDAKNPAEARLLFMNAVGLVLADVKSLGGGQGDYLSVHRIARWEFYRRATEEELPAMGDFYTCSFVVTWGP